MTHRRVAAVLLVILAAALAVLTPALAVVDLGSPAATRLWVLAPERQFVCSATYVDPFPGAAADGRTWILTAGHCVLAGGAIVGRNTDQIVFAAVNWRAVEMHEGTDLAIGTAPEIRDEAGRSARRLATTLPYETLLYVHGFPLGVEAVTPARAVRPDELQALGLPAYVIDALVSAQIAVILTPRGDIRGGSSGSAVLDGFGQIVGVVWGLVAPELVPATVPYDVVLVTPVERLREVLNRLRAP